MVRTLTRMRLGVVSDVHNNVEALAYALERLAGCDLVVSLGDLVSDYRVLPQIIHLARDAGLMGIRGNHEKAIFMHPGSRLRHQLADDDVAYLDALPPQRELTIDGRRVLLTHGSPWDDPADYRCHYVSSRDPADRARLAASHAEVVLIGHTHVAMNLRLDSVLVINPGSCGEGRDNEQRLSFAELDFGQGVATTYRIRPGVSPEVILSAGL
jgi:putative phosphoesterase